MEIKKLIKKGASIQSILITLVIAIFAFTSVYLFVSGNESQVGITPDPNFVQAYNSVNATQKSIEDISDSFQGFGNAVRETDASDYGYYGLKGALAIMKLPFNIIGMATGFIQSVVNSQNIIPDIVIYTVLSIITFIILFAAISFITNRGKDQT